MKNKLKKYKTEKDYLEEFPSETLEFNTLKEAINFARKDITKKKEKGGYVSFKLFDKTGKLKHKLKR